MSVEDLVENVGAKLVLYKMIEKNIFVVLADRGDEFVTWIANLHPRYEGLSNGHYFHNNYDPDHSLAMKDYQNRN